jgi:hypothetical protein
MLTCKGWGFVTLLHFPDIFRVKISLVQPRQLFNLISLLLSIMKAARQNEQLIAISQDNGTHCCYNLTQGEEGPAAAPAAAYFGAQDR